ncbi:MAG: hypothetical protein IZT59_01965 [Verrucomicrobia bacterium]|jgi:hypothetical protein|nr:hypothetical protein [Verrucomicrobiota bacterium]|tara:strand:+ start:23718 stop:24002 length:285 start_codon:yes stop_codon:yes gene_type:complete
MKTLISAAGIHPNGGKSHDYSPKNLKPSGYALRNWLNFQTYHQLYFRVLEKEENIPKESRMHPLSTARARLAPDHIQEWSQIDHAPARRAGKQP